MIISILNLKGGAGKSTVAANLAVAFAETKSTILVDSDAQGSGNKFMSIRSEDENLQEENLSFTFLPDANVLKSQIRKIAGQFDVVIVDGAPSVALEKSTAFAISFSDVVLMPTNPNAPDLWSLQIISQKVEESRMVRENLKAFFLLNCFRSGTNAGEKAINTFSEDEQLNTFPLLKSRLALRVAYADSFANGKSVLEWDNPTAKEEFQRFFNEFKDVIGA